MSNRLWAKHVTPKTRWQRIPLVLKVFLILSLLVGVAYAAVQVVTTNNGLFHTVGTGFIVTIPSGPFMNMNLTDPLTQFQEIKQNATWSIQNTGKVPMSVHYSTNLPTNITLLMLSNNVNFQGQGISPGATAIGWFNTTVGHFTAGDIPFILTIEGCYPAGLC